MSQHPRTTHHPPSRMLQRMQNLFEDLKVIRHSLDARLHLYHLSRNQGLYCPSCTPSCSIGACGPTCPLLRPTTRRGFYTSASEEQEEARADKLQADFHIYQSILNGMYQWARSVSVATASRWEQSAAVLKEGLETPTERHERHEWVVQLRRGDGWDKGVFKRFWSFERAWGRGWLRQRWG
jgi:hypothetical protein